MTPPTFWRRISQRSVGTTTPSQQQPLLSDQDRANGLMPSHDRQNNLSHQSSNATIRVSNLRPSHSDHDNDGVVADYNDSGLKLSSTDSSGKRKALFMIILNLSILGSQLAWCLELSYGTPYLLSLGLSAEATALVWLAGPISGMIAQPVIGSVSDASTSPFRRRYYMLFSTAFIFTSTLTLAFAQPVAEVIVDFLNLGLADWDPVRQSHVKTVTQISAIVSFWILDFALNGLAAASRALVLDTLKSKETDYGNAWLGRMIHVGNILGYGAGYLDLSHIAALSWLGGDQFRKFAFVSLVGLLVSVGITCFFINERSLQEGESTFSSSARSQKNKHAPSVFAILKRSAQDVWSATRRLPRPIRRVCMVQLVAWLGWFPFLFYATTWIGTFEKTGGGVKEREKRERKGNEGMLLFAVISLVFGVLLPLFSLGDRCKSDRDSSLLRKTISRVQSAHPHLAAGISSRTYWTVSCLLFAMLMIGTLFVQTSTQAVWLIGLVGIPWSITGWVPMSLVMAFVKEAESGLSEFEFPEDFYSPTRIAERRRLSAAGQSTRGQVQNALRDCDPLPVSGNGLESGQSTIRPRKPRGSADGSQSARLGSGSYISRGSQVVRETGTGGAGAGDVQSHRSHSGISLPRDYDDEEDDGDGETGDDTIDPSSSASDTQTRGGTILGILNLSIVLPQFVVSLISSAIFSHFDKVASSSGEDMAAEEGAAPGVTYVLCFGGVAALVAAALTRFVPLTRRERLIQEGDDAVDEEEEEEEDAADLTL